jgi:5-methylcytosine-specific restriction endonuclease McrA
MQAPNPTRGDRAGARRASLARSGCAFLRISNKMEAMITTYTDHQERIIQELYPLGVGGWHATHGLSQGFRCAYCDKDYLASFDAYHCLTLDHIIPKSCGGAETDENVVVCCSTCNWIKHIFLPTGNSREERIADARCYVQEQRLKREAEVEKIRLLVRGDSPTANNHDA